MEWRRFVIYLWNDPRRNTNDNNNKKKTTTKQRKVNNNDNKMKTMTIIGTTINSSTFTVQLVNFVELKQVKLG